MKKTQISMNCKECIHGTLGKIWIVPEYLMTQVSLGLLSFAVLCFIDVVFFTKWRQDYGLPYCNAHFIAGVCNKWNLQYLWGMPVTSWVWVWGLCVWLAQGHVSKKSPLLADKMVWQWHCLQDNLEMGGESQGRDETSHHMLIIVEA